MPAGQYHRTRLDPHTMTRNVSLTDPLATLLENLLGPLRGQPGRPESPVGPLRAHRGGHDHVELPGDAATDDVLVALREQAMDIHEQVVHEHGIFAVEFLGATGSGKTRLIEQLVDRAPSEESIGAVVGDVAGEDDANRLRALGVEVVNVNTGGECHLDAALVQDAIDELDLASLDTLYLENVGNMVCPADFPLGSQARVLVVSTTEGDDVVRKHPGLFQVADAAVINKVDLAPAVAADVDRMAADVKTVTPSVPVFRTTAETGAGVPELAAHLRSQAAEGHTAADHRHPMASGSQRVDGPD